MDGRAPTASPQLARNARTYAIALSIDATPTGAAKLFPGQVDQHDVRVLTEAIEDDMFSIRCDVETAHVSFVAETCELTLFAGHEIEQPEVQILRPWPVHEMSLVKETIAVRADAEVSREVVLGTITSHSPERSAGRACGRGRPGEMA